VSALDPVTVIFVSSLLGLLCSIVLFVLRRSFPASIGGLTHWACSCLMSVASIALFGMYGALPELFTVVIPNSLLVGSFMVIYAGLLNFSGYSPKNRLLVGFLIPIVGLTACFTFVWPSYETRVLLITAADCVLLLAAALLIFKINKNSLAGRFAGSAALLAAAISAARFFATLYQNDPSTHLLDTNSLQKTYLASFAFSILMINVGLLMLANERLRATLEYIAAHDELSGAYSRGTFIELLRSEVARSQRHRRPLALLMLDLDNFKLINDRFGHPIGDQVIVDFARRSNALLRQDDFLGRYGGEEFIALLPETTLEEACAVAERIRANIAASAGAGLPLYTVSIGVAAAAYGEMTGETLLLLADKELYLAKQNGRNRVEPANQEIPADGVIEDLFPDT
jgi:diguanylate cyclase (GGDEF)-like protein